MNYYNYGFVKVCAVSPKIHLAKPLLNKDEILKIFKLASKNNLVVLFPELSLTGYTCEDLFLSSELLEEAHSALFQLVDSTVGIKSLLVVGLPYQASNGRLYNMACAIYDGKILGMVPKTYLPNYGEFYEKRWFTSGDGVNLDQEDNGQKFTITSNQLFSLDKAKIGIEICEDLWAPIPPSCQLAINGANIILNLSASNELINKKEYREELVKQQSARLNCAYVYAASSMWESSKDIVFSGHSIIAENGTILATASRFNLESSSISVEVDLDKLNNERRKNSTFSSSKTTDIKNNSVKIKYKLPTLARKINKAPFVPSGALLEKRSQEIIQIQAAGLARRLMAINRPKIVLGLSGGLDSTLALLVALEAIKMTRQPASDILAISMPGFGTSQKTKDQASGLAKGSNITFKEIDITKTVTSHFKDIGHDPKKYDVTFENSQARERTQILFDTSNQVGGIVLGTGDLSEIALGWSTFNGDHMSNYNVNSSIPKTLVKHLVKYVANTNPDLKEVLNAVLDTTISPELKPIEDGKIQDTEALIGPYILHDFFIFNYIRNGFSKEKILVLAKLAFQNDFTEEEIEKNLNVFFERFRKNQFKRTTSPSGPKVGTVSLSPRGDWRMPDET